MKIQSGDDAVRVERSIGFLTLNLSPDNGPIISESKTFGLANRDGEFTVGYFQESLAALPNSCHLILWVDDEKEIKGLERLVGNFENLCIRPHK